MWSGISHDEGAVDAERRPATTAAAQGSAEQVAEPGWRFVRAKRRNGRFREVPVSAAVKERPELIYQ